MVSLAPFRLRVLGPVVVHRVDGEATSSCITQPRHVALLCYLVLASPRGLQSRDTVVDLLWPGYDQARGRRAVRNALYALRQQLGTRAIISVGENLVGIDPAVVSCDAIELERRGSGALEAGATADPFQGFYVDSAHAFDRWMSTERARLISLLAERHRPPLVSDSGVPSVAMRRPHAVDAAAMYVRGHYLFLRSAHGGSPDDLLRCRDYFTRARELDVDFAPALAGLANFYAVAARRGVLAPFHATFAEAIRLSREALTLDPTLAIPHVHLAVKALYLDDDLDLAGREFAAAVTNDPEYAEGHRFYGVWLGLEGRHSDALREMEVAARLEPDIPHIMSSLGAARVAVGDQAGAERALRHTLSLDPRHAPARARLVQLLEDDGKFEAAIAERRLLPGGAADAFAEARAQGGSEGYRRQLHGAMQDEARRIEARLVERHEPTVQDIFAPPIVRLVSLLARIGDLTRARSWQLQGVASRPALARWFESVAELRRR